MGSYWDCWYFPFYNAQQNNLLVLLHAFDERTMLILLILRIQKVYVFDSAVDICVIHDVFALPATLFVSNSWENNILSFNNKQIQIYLN